MSVEEDLRATHAELSVIKQRAQGLQEHIKFFLSGTVCSGVAVTQEQKDAILNEVKEHYKELKKTTTKIGQLIAGAS